MVDVAALVVEAHGAVHHRPGVRPGEALAEVRAAAQALAARAAVGQPAQDHVVAGRDVRDAGPDLLDDARALVTDHGRHRPGVDALHASAGRSGRRRSRPCGRGSRRRAARRARAPGRRAAPRTRRGRRPSRPPSGCAGGFGRGAGHLRVPFSRLPGFGRAEICQYGRPWPRRPPDRAREIDEDRPRVAASCPRRAPRLGPDARRRAPVGAALAARGCRARSGSGHPRVHPVPQGRCRRCPPTSRAIATARDTATPACASICAAAATPRASCATSTSRRSRTTPRTSSIWLEQQPWCTGRVGMIGISWGGFNGLQVAARRPPQLDCVISLCSTDDRYADDVHYIGGCVLGADMLVVGVDDARLQRAPAGSRHRRRHAGGRCGCERLRETPPLHRGLARPSAPRRVLEAGLGVRGLRRRSRARSTWSAAGTTATRTPSRASSRATAGRARA